MGCDIHVCVQKQTDGVWEDMPAIKPFDWRSYGMFGFLADVRNYSAAPPIAEQRGLPDGFSADYEVHDVGEHSFSWLSVAELLAFDYDQTFEDRRVTRQTGPNSWDSGVTGDPGDGEQTTFRQFLGEGFFRDLDILRVSGAERIVFGFDS